MCVCVCGGGVMKHAIDRAAVGAGKHNQNGAICAQGCTHTAGFGPQTSVCRL